MKTKKEKPWEPGDGIYFLKNTDEHPRKWRIEIGCVDVNEEQDDGPVRAGGYLFYTKKSLAGATHAYHSVEDAENVINSALAVEAKAEARHARTLQDLRDKFRIGDGCDKSFRDLVTYLCSANEIRVVELPLEASVVANALQAAYNMGVADSEAIHKD